MEQKSASWCVSYAGHGTEMLWLAGLSTAWQIPTMVHRGVYKLCSMLHGHPIKAVQTEKQIPVCFTMCVGLRRKEMGIGSYRNKQFLKVSQRDSRCNIEEKKTCKDRKYTGSVDPVCYYVDFEFLMADGQETVTEKNGIRKETNKIYQPKYF